MTLQRRFVAGLIGLLALAWCAYLPGLGGDFLFDDFVNLNAIGDTGPVDNWPTFFRYLTSGTADPTGRPLALLSFLIDARDWPADPAPFLRTNVLLHLLNGLLLAHLLRALGRSLEPDDASNDAAALLAAGLWLLHPLFVSTTLYVIQREAMLPATFMLTGLLCYVHGRRLLGTASVAPGLAWMSVGLVGGSILAVLCKGNGILLPVLAWVVEAAVLRRGDTAPRSAVLRRAHWALVVVPSLAVATYLLGFLRHLHSPLGTRDWTIAERLLTEPRVIVDYLHLLVVPRSVSTGLYNDAYQVSTSLVQPLSTLPALLLVLALPLLAWSVKRRFPALTAAILFFLAGHLLESSVIPLELYFEHRNYVPAMLMFWPLARVVCRWKAPVRWRAGAALLLLAIVFATTFQRVWLWGQPQLLASLWAGQNPESSRAQATMALFDIRAGKPELALARLEPEWKRKPYDLQIAFNYVDAACSHRGISAEESRRVARALAHADSGMELIHRWMSQSIDSAAAAQCRGLTLADPDAWLAAAIRNPRIASDPGRAQDIEPLLAQIALRRGQPDAALHHFNLALAAYVTPDAAARNTSLLASSGYYQQALAHLDVYESLKAQTVAPARGMPWLHARVLAWQGYWDYEMAVLRAKLHAEIKAGQHANRDAK